MTAHLVTRCDCHDPAHMMAFWYDLNAAAPAHGEKDPDFAEFYIETQLNQYLPWWKRLDAAVRYVLGRRSRYSFGHWDEGSIGLAGTKKLQEALKEFIRRREAKP